MDSQSAWRSGDGALGQYDAVQARLQKTKLSILTEIQHYPTPIPHCDQQFNWLLEQRDTVSAELQALEEMKQKAEAELAAFVHSSRFIEP